MRNLGSYLIGTFGIFFVGSYIFAFQQCTDCTDPTRPWMRGNIEYYCGMNQEVVDRLKRDNPDKSDKIKLCKCKHVCDTKQEETQGRKWDSRCEARCNPQNCACPHPCE